ncbi:MAG: diadenylate cyclase CdaA [Bavariicoccus seileri]|uniref:diadenylate cyclase CdaA n=1 Tax=Bavariicoccus seileri TaxID=549685 RepID=UPI003F908F1E
MGFDWNDLVSWQTVTNVIDIAVVWFLLYKLLSILLGNRSVHLVKGIVVVIVIKAISYTVGLNTLDWIMNLVIQWGIIALIVVFQPEIRRGLEHIGRSSFFSRNSREANPSEKMIDSLVTAIKYMAKRRIGCLISIEMENSLQEYIDTGIPLDADISSQLLINTFIPNTPLHDGAVIIRDYKIASAASYLPLSESPLIPKELGTRHRAAVGLSEASDAFTLIVSEETGGISVTYENQLYRDLSEEQLVDLMKKNLISEPVEENPTQKMFKDFLDSLKLGGHRK